MRKKVLRDYDVSVRNVEDLSALANIKLGGVSRTCSLGSLTVSLCLYLSDYLKDLLHIPRSPKMEVAAMDPLRQLAVAAPSPLYLAVTLTAGALFSLGTSHFNSRSIELWLSRFQGLVIWDLCPFNAKLLLLLYPRQVPSHLALVFLLKVLTGGGNFLDAHEYDDYIPKVDTEASWNKEVLTETLAVFGGVLPPVDTERNPEGAKTQVFFAVMAFVMAIVTVLRIFLGFLKKRAEAALGYDIPIDFVDTIARRQPLLLPAISPSEYSVTKRLGDLEDMVIILSKKPAEMPFKKAEMLNAAVRRVDVLETELLTTKKVNLRS